MMRCMSMMHQSVKHSLGHSEALKHCHSLTVAHIGGSGIRSPRLDPSRALHPVSPSACYTPSLSATVQMPLLELLLMLLYTQNPLMSPGYDKKT